MSTNIDFILNLSNRKRCHLIDKIFKIIFFFLFIVSNRTGQAHLPMYTEILPGGQTLALMIPVLTETMAGRYVCSASYANTKALQMSVDVETFGKWLTQIWPMLCART